MDMLQKLLILMICQKHPISGFFQDDKFAETTGKDDRAFDTFG